ncbi:hypothetical protein AGABI1DRAFT_80306 [Agaricus bisporus var. burnettii JB137-S8]|uniref:AB hydrolase-1 domain-containing protein n=1 Tax=Agaricus bisporus var. burnettii (strain JB137-S8 / ATCC MYA-4627 / FGSC 10392) TaxID=597362 RepID=K5WIM6_AGABU|nr:uncharacterized protein AGABI1DRAFT_80306 [Agaricus bisporus var. burnettii JB137-S8]EKM75101.1 hypothetical protein AGABI1DRAFT_80306 [Agaricus bisporus var. burnettii JB137-S8]
MTSSYPPIPVTLPKPINYRPLLPVYPPSDPLNYPPLPSKLRKPTFDAPYTLSTHIIPAAHLRRGPYIPVPAPPLPDAPKDERKKAFKALKESIEKYGEDPNIAQDKHERVLWNVLNRYVRNDLTKANSTGTTLFFAHGGGFPKEIWEPVLGRILKSMDAHVIDEVWLWESFQHGDAGLLNSENMASLFYWSDNSRDIINFFLHFLPSDTVNKHLPIHLSRVSKWETERRISSGFGHRNVVAIGHSIGGTAIALGAVDYPKLFSAIVLIDPIIFTQQTPTIYEWAMKALWNALLRKDTWDSKASAYAEFASSPYYKPFDRDVLKIFVDCGLYETTVTTPTGATKSVVKSKLTTLQDAMLYAGGSAAVECFDSLSKLDDSVRLHWIMAGAKHAPRFGPPEAPHERVWIRPRNASNTIILKAGHLVIQEAPVEVAHDIIQFLETNLPYIQTHRSNL